MQRLPAVVAGDTVGRLPLCERSGVAWIRAVTSGAADPLQPDQRGADDESRLAAALADDPALALWCVCRRQAAGLAAPQSVSELASWLTRQALTDLVDGAPVAWSDELGPDSGPDSSDWPELVRVSVAVALLARQQASAEVADSAYLLGLLHQADAWAHSCGMGWEPNGRVRSHDFLPDWLRDCLARLSADSEPGSPSAAVAAAISSLSDPGKRAADSDAHLQYARQAAEMWACDGVESGPLRLEYTPILVQLARLRHLERRFDEQLLREKLDSLRQFAYGASHEINNPLANISSRAQTLLRDERDPERRRKLATINAQAFRAHEMISDLMLFAKPPRLRPEEVDLLQLVDQVLDELAPAALEQGTALTRLPPATPVVARVDPQHLAVAIRAMCVNSLDALGTGGRVDVKVEGAGSQSLDDGQPASGQLAAACQPVVRITISDTGPGIPPEARRHLFDPYFSGREAGRGLGLGLSKTWRIVTEHGGQIRLAAGGDQGACFIVELPA